MKAHIVKDGIIVNTVIVSELADGMIEATSGSIGWAVVDGVPVEPEPVNDTRPIVTALAATDAEMARVIEDIYAVLTDAQRAALPQAAHDKIDQRKALRAKL